jgi:PiT family inorganic phosphate transporter
LADFLYIAGIIFVAYSFDFFNGFHDAANAISTVVSTRVLSPQRAILLAAFFNFIAFVVFGVAVAGFISSGIVNPSFVDANAVLGALLGAITWDIITWRLGLPTSSSHALIGGLVGATVTKSGFSVVEWAGLGKVVAFIFVSPLVGMAAAFGLSIVFINIFYKSTTASINQYFRRLQLVSASLLSLAHGTNDAQKTMGVVTLLLFTAGYVSKASVPPLWVVLAAHFSIAMGTALGGWRIVRTMGMRITKLQPFNGFAAETAAAATILSSSFLGIPVSTTHVVSGAIMGVGATRRLSAVRWGVARRIVLAWFITIPASALMASLSYFVIAQITHL